MITEVATHKKNISSKFSYRSSHTFFKKHWNVYRNSHTIFNIKNISAAQFLHKISWNSCTFFFQKQLHSLHSFLTKCTKDFFIIFRWLWKNIFDGWFKSLMVLHEYHQPGHNAYRNSQINQACFARMSQLLDHRPKAHIVSLVNVFLF